MRTIPPLASPRKMAKGMVSPVHGLPYKVILRIMEMLEDDLQVVSRLMRTSRFLRTAVVLHLQVKVHNVLRRLGVGDPKMLVWSLDRWQALLSGPDFLDVLLTGSVPVTKFTSRLEIHIPLDVGYLDKVVEAIENFGFKVTREWTDRQSVRMNGQLWLDYEALDVVTSKVVQLKNKDFQYAYIIMGRSITTSFLSILAQPTTAFMNAISSNTIHVLYPRLTNARRGIINTRKPAKAVPGILQYFQHTIDVKTRLSDWKEYADHHCGQDANCPFKLRDMLDGLSGSFPIVAKPLHFTHPRIPVIPQLIWRLRCASSCEKMKPLPGQEHGEVGHYIWKGGWIEDIDSAEDDE
ncbi:hypothetical protein FA13DRAFT_1799853 [Coprinellus micaceus]|uniref:Uncharacterized protein n=1 Tax=Coprinellus micaceus TaxID=71717 RepID=A0A4Y7SII3_COPMI|nr:hypothetical protein FA13DRAFT_1799853 [Coprinellus micaceus]